MKNPRSFRIAYAVVAILPIVSNTYAAPRIGEHPYTTLTNGCITRTLTCGQSFSDVLQNTGCQLGDGTNVDQFNIALVKDRYVTINMVAVFPPFFGIYSGGNFIGGADEWDQVGATMHDFQVPHTGTFGIVAGALQSGKTGFYNIDVTCSTTPLSNDPCDATLPLAIGSTQSGALSSSDCRYGTTYSDTFTFSATEGAPMQITYSPAFAPYIEAMPFDGLSGVWRQSEQPGPITFTYWPEFTGTHRLLVASSTADAIGGYTVRIDAAEPEACGRRRAVRH